jgi:hypothetical protein
MLTGMGIEAFAERAERELLATGEPIRKRTVETRKDLTSQELQVAQMARDGLSNPEIGALVRSTRCRQSRVECRNGTKPGLRPETGRFPAAPQLRNRSARRPPPAS